MIKSLNSALSIALKQDPNVVIFGEDVGFFGGVFRALKAFRRNTDLTESSILLSQKEASLQSPWAWV